MNAITLDRNALNGLFENQKKLDDLFDSIFDDDNFFIGSTPSPAQAATCHLEFKKVEHPRADNGSKGIKSFYAIKHHPFFFVVPITLELTVLYFVITHLL